MFTFRGRIFVPNQKAIKQYIPDEFHRSPYMVHLGYQNLFSTIKNNYFWHGMRKDILDYLAKCLECQQVKEEHQHLAGLLHPLPIPEWKWDTVTLDFITGLPRSRRKNDSIMVVVDKLSKTTHFILVKSTYKTMEIANIFMKAIFRLHGFPKMVIFDRDVKLTSAFWRSLFVGLGTQIQFSTSYHPQTDGQIKRVNQVIEDMLRMYDATTC